MDKSTEAKEFEDEICGQFGAATGCDKETAFEVLFRQKEAKNFVAVSGEDALELIRQQLTFYAWQKQNGEAEKDIQEILLEQLVSAQKSIYLHLEKLFKDKLLDSAEYQQRLENFVEHTKSEKLKAAITSRGEKLLGKNFLPA